MNKRRAPSPFTIQVPGNKGLFKSKGNPRDCIKILRLVSSTDFSNFFPEREEAFSIVTIPAKGCTKARMYYNCRRKFNCVANLIASRQAFFLE